MFFSNEELDRHIRRRPSVQLICVGGFLQQPMFVTDDILAVPLSAIGSRDLVTLIADYVSMDLDIPISVNEVEDYKQRWKNTSPAIALIWHPIHDTGTKELERSADIYFSRGKRNLSLITGDKIDIVGTIILHDDDHEYKLFPPQSKRRQRLWFSKEEALSFQKSLILLASQSEKNKRIALALQFYLDATNEKSEEFKIIKFYNVLECLSAKFKKDGVGSRDATRKMLEVKGGQHWSVEYNGVKITYDLIAVTGKFRDVLMHGSKISKNTFSKKDRGIIDVLAFEPYKIANELHQTVDNALWKIANSNIA